MSVRLRPAQLVLAFLPSMSGCEEVFGALGAAADLCTQEVFTVTTDLVGDDPEALCDPATGDCDTLRAAFHSASFRPPDPRVIRLSAGATYEIEDQDVPATFVAAIANRETGRVGPNGLPHVRTPLTVEGRGAVLRRAEDAPDLRFLHVLSEGDLTLIDLSIEGGALTDHDGGALYNEGTLTLEDVELRDHWVAWSEGREGGAIYTSGELRTTDTTFRGNDGGSGAAIHVASGAEATLTRATLEENGGGTESIVGVAERGALAIVDSSVASNTAFASAVVSRGEVTIEGSTFTENSGANSGSVFAMEGTVAARRSTFSGEIGTGAVRCAGTVEELILEDVTITDSDEHGAVMDERCVLVVSNSVIANNGADDCSYQVAPAAGETNLDSDGSCGFAVTADPLLGALAANGGPTRTHLPADGSPLIDAGSTCLGTDQRGQPRPAGATCDVGAVEAR